MTADTQGFNAYMNGVLKEHNPYHPGSSDYNDWNIGWDDGREQYYDSLPDTDFHSLEKEEEED